MIITFVLNEGSRRNVSCIAMRPQFNPGARNALTHRRLPWVAEGWIRFQSWKTNTLMETSDRRLSERS